MNMFCNQRSNIYFYKNDRVNLYFYTEEKKIRETNRMMITTQKLNRARQKILTTSRYSKKMKLHFKLSNLQTINFYKQ